MQRRPKIPPAPPLSATTAHSTWVNLHCIPVVRALFQIYTRVSPSTNQHYVQSIHPCSTITVLHNMGPRSGGKLCWPYSQTFREGGIHNRSTSTDHFPILLILNTKHSKLNMPLWLYTIPSYIFKRTHIQQRGKNFSFTKLFTWHISI